MEAWPKMPPIRTAGGAVRNAAVAPSALMETCKRISAARRQASRNSFTHRAHRHQINALFAAGRGVGVMKSPSLGAFWRKWRLGVR